MIRAPFNRPKTVKIVASTNNIPTTFGTGAGSLVLTDCANVGRENVYVVNDTSSTIAFVFDADENPVPSSSTTEQIYVVAKQFLIMDRASVFAKCYIRSDSGSSITSGTVYVSVW